MKSKLFIISALIFTTVGLFYSCKKDRSIIYKTEYTGDPKSKFADFTDFANALSIPRQLFNADVTTGATIRGDHGYTFIFKPGNLLDYMGNPVTGKVQIELIEVTNATEMLATGALTGADDGILESAAMFKITIKQNGMPVMINKSNPVKVEVTMDPNADMTNVKLFKGQELIDSSKIKRDTTVKWKPYQDSSGGFKINSDSLKKVYDSIQKAWLSKRCIKFDLPYSGWCNLDAYRNSGTGKAIHVEVPGYEDNTDNRVLMYLNTTNLKGLWEMRFNSSLKDFNSDPFNMPVGMNMRIIVVIRTKDGVVKYQYKDISNDGTKLKFDDLKAISDQDLEDFFKKL